MRYLAAALLLIATSAHAQVYNYFSPGCALTGNATSQTVNLATGACISGNLPVTNLNGGLNASASTVWTGNGTWSAAPGTPGGSTNQVQVNNGGVLAGYTGLTFNPSTNVLSVGTSTTSTTGTITVAGASANAIVQSGGAQMTVTGKPLILTTTGGGALNIAGSAGSGSGTGTSIAITAGNTGTSATSPGGAVTLTGGTGNASKTGGFLNIVGGAGYSTTGTAGDVSLQGGIGNTASLSGNLDFATNNTARLGIDRYGTWFIGGTSGTAGQCLESQGNSTTPLWENCVNSVSVPKFAYAAFNTGASYCTISYDSNVTACSYNSVGAFTVTIVSGVFTSVSTYVCTANASGSGYTIGVSTASATQVNIAIAYNGTAPANVSFYLSCLGT